MGMRSAQGITRRLLESLLLALVAGTLALVALAHLVPAMGHPVFIIRSGSMTPAIPVGGAVVLDLQPADDIRVGDVVTCTFPPGVGCILTGVMAATPPVPIAGPFTVSQLAVGSISTGSSKLTVGG